MKIDIKCEADLERLFDVLSNEIVSAHHFYKLLNNLNESIKEYSTEFNQSNTFWYLTFEALIDATLSHLCRVYDQELNSLNLPNLLETIKANLELFSKEKFKARLAENPHVESLAASNPELSVESIDHDLSLVSNSDPLVKKLTIWRGNLVAHRGAKVALGKNQILKDNPLSDSEIQELLSRALYIVNKYSSAFRASTQSKGIIGQDDYEGVLNLIRSGLTLQRTASQQAVNEGNVI